MSEGQRVQVNGRQGFIFIIMHGEALVVFDGVGVDWVPLDELEVIS